MGTVEKAVRRIGRKTLKTLSLRASFELAEFSTDTVVLVLGHGWRTPIPWSCMEGIPAGTGKTVVALHRAVHLARAHRGARVLLATLSDTLASALRGSLRRLIGNEPAIAERLEVHSLSGIGPRLYAASFRSIAQVERAIAAVREAGLTPVELDVRPGGASGSVAVGTMHLAKGLEFRAVAVAACDDDVIPLQSRIETVADEADLEDVYAPSNCQNRCSSTKFAFAMSRSECTRAITTASPARTIPRRASSGLRCPTASRSAGTTRGATLR